MLSVFRPIHIIRKPMEWEIQNFCDSIFDELDENPDLEAHLTEIQHYKEKENLEHEFLLAFVTHARKKFVLRLERTTPPRRSKSLLDKIKQTSSSIFPALDTIRIASSSDPLTSGMNRGPCIRVVTLPMPPQTSFTLREFCLILSFFPAFSPQYKLKEEQCYWFCNIVVSTVRAAFGSALMVEEEGFNRAGKFGKFSVQFSARTRKLFVDSYSIVRFLGQSSQLDAQQSVTLDSVDTLVSMLAVPSSEARTRAAIALTRLASRSPEHRQMVIEAGAAKQLIGIISSASSQLKVHLLTALDAIIDESFLHGLEQADDVIRQVLQVLTDDERDVRVCGENILAKLAQCDELHPAVKNSTPQLRELLNNRNSDVRLAGIKIMAQLAERIELQSEFGNAIQQIIKLREDNDEDVRRAVVTLMVKHTQCTELHPAVKKALPQFFELLKVRDSDVNFAVISTMINLAEKIELHSVIEDGILQLLKHLEYRNLHFHVISIMAKLAEHTILHLAIRGAISQFIKLLKSWHNDDRLAAVNTIAKLAEDTELHPAIGYAIPQLFELLNTWNSHVRLAVVNLMSKLAANTGLHHAIGDAIPRLLELLDARNSDVRLAVAEIMMKFAEHTELHLAIGEAIPQLLELEHKKLYVRLSVANLMGNLAECPELHFAIENAILQLPVDEDSDVQLVVANTITKLAGRGQFQAMLQLNSTTPRLPDR